MRKTLITNLVKLICLTGLHSLCFAQSTAKSAVGDQPNFISKFFEPKSGRDSSTETPITEINIKAVRHFIKTFDQTEDVHWHKVANGIVVYFTENGIASRADYDRNGNWLYNIRTYEERLLPKNIRAIVKRTYFDYVITSVSEIRDEQRTAYIIRIEDETSLKAVSIYDEEMNVIEEYVKSK